VAAKSDDDKYLDESRDHLSAFVNWFENKDNAKSIVELIQERGKDEDGPEAFFSNIARRVKTLLTIANLSQELDKLEKASQIDGVDDLQSQLGNAIVVRVYQLIDIFKEKYGLYSVTSVERGGFPKTPYIFGTSVVTETANHVHKQGDRVENTLKDINAQLTGGK